MASQTVTFLPPKVALVNGWIAYNLQNKLNKITQRRFRELVIDGLMDGYKKESQQRSGPKFDSPHLLRLTERHFPRQFQDKKHQPNCI
ncbi:hypothetical protein J437_LFUL019713, partial [Ladona fulva]